MKILLVEDSRAVAALMGARLAALGHEMVMAENGQQALEAFRAVAPDLVLMDIEMPVMNGFEATSRIRAFEATQKWAWTPVIFLTATASEANLVTAIEAGGDDFLPKSVSEPVLQARMKALLRIATMRHLLAVANRKLEEMASHDGLTGLWNRRHLDMTADVAWERAVAAGTSFGLLMLDIDNFKKYNDHYGHQAGDDCLRAVAGRIEQVVVAAQMDGRQPDALAARYGGEEFAVILPGVTAGTMVALAGEIVHAVRGQAIAHEKNAEWGVVTLSVGGVRLEKAAGRIADLFRSADQRLYQAKQSGRNRAVLN